MIYAKQLRLDLGLDPEASRKLALVVVRNLRHMPEADAYSKAIQSVRYTQNNVDVTVQVMSGLPMPMSTRFYPVLQSQI